MHIVHIDMCVVLRELQHLRAGVRTMRCVDEIVALRGALKMQDRKMTDKDIAGGGKCRTGI